MKTKRTSCIIDGCKELGILQSKRGTRYFVKGYCAAHYRIWKKYGDPLKRKVAKYDGRTKDNRNRCYWSMVMRCTNPRDISYKNYGAKGVTVCDRWLGRDGFNNFIEDMGERPKGWSLDRIDNDKGYSPENCRWASRHTQASNRKNNQERVGVRKYYSRFKATFRFNGKLILEKTFPTEEEAIKARIAVEKEYLGDDTSYAR